MVNAYKLISLILIFFVFFSISVNAVLKDTIILNLKYNKEQITNNKLYLTQINFPDKELNEKMGKYTIKMIDNKGKVLYENKFDFPLEIYASPSPDWFDEKGNQIYIPSKKEEQSIQKLDISYKKLFIPYTKGAYKIFIYEKAKPLLTKDISYIKKAIDDSKNGKTSLDNAQETQNLMPPTTIKSIAIKNITPSTIKKSLLKINSKITGMIIWLYKTN